MNPQAKPKEPADQESFGHLLWELLGGENINYDVAIGVLQLSSKSSLSQLLHGHVRPSRTYVLEKDWRNRLKKHNPKAWEKHHKKFEEYVAKFDAIVRRPKNKPKHIPAEELAKTDWRKAVGSEIRRFVKEKGDDAQTLAHDTQDPAVKQQWGYVLRGDARASPETFCAAMREVCRLYYLEPSDPLYRTFENLRNIDPQPNIV
ncbi:MAG: hypothetical protein SFW62_00075 [Alphaproteobacteria bacterium]|nr:hypothetical protein [Alphaproteobacteria bacterium]